MSLASRKLKSSGTKGRGIGNRGRRARRRTITLSPITATESDFLCANRPSDRSARRKSPPPAPGKANAKATASVVALNSRISSVGLVAAEDDNTIAKRLSAGTNAAFELMRSSR